MGRWIHHRCLFFAVVGRCRLIVAGLFFENTTTFPLGQMSVCPWSVREKESPAFLHTEQWQWSPAPLFGIVLLVLPLPLRTSLTHPNTQIAPPKAAAVHDSSSSLHCCISTPSRLRSSAASVSVSMLDIPPNAQMRTHTHKCVLIRMLDIPLNT